MLFFCCNFGDNIQLLLSSCHSFAIIFILNRRTDNVSDRITVVIDTANVRKLRNIQAKMITTSPKSVSFSRVLNLVVVEGLKKFKA